MSLSGAQNGCANPTCATRPRPKNVEMRPRVRSRNWSGMTRSSGLYSSFRLPTALADRMYSTPSVLKPKMLARKFSSDRQQPVAGAVAREERDALAAQRADDVRRRRLAERRLDAPLLAVGELRHVVQTAAADDADRVMRHSVDRTRVQPRSELPLSASGSSFDRRLGHDSSARLLADVAGGDVGIVLEEYQILALDRLADERRA